MGKLLIDERPLTVLPSLVKEMGMERAVILQQIHWLLQSPNNGVEHEGERWVWGKYQEWCDNYFPFWEADTLRKHVVKLEKDGFVISAQIKGFDRTKHYRINYEKVDELEPPMRHDHATSKRKKFLDANRHDHATSKRDDHASSMRHDDASCYITETSTEITTETTQRGEDAGATPAPPPTPWHEFLLGLCWVCYGHSAIDLLTEKQKGVLTSEAKRMRDADFGLDDLRAWFQEKWKKDFRWTKNNQHERPQPADVRSGIASIRETEPESIPTYTVDLPGVYALPVSPAPQPAPPPALPPLAHDDPWAVCIKELSLTLGSGFVPTLAESRAEAAGERPDPHDGKTKPLYRIIVPAARAKGLDYFINQAGPAIRRKLGSVLGKPVMVEIVAEESTPVESVEVVHGD